MQYRSCAAAPTETFMVKVKFHLNMAEIGIIADPASVNTVIATAKNGNGFVFVNADNYNAANQVIRVIYY